MSIADDPEGAEAAAEAEFDTVASWTVEAVSALGPEHALAAACRGSGSPAALRWLVDRLGVADGDVLLDVGAGLGGPAAWAAEHAGARPVLAEPAGRAAGGGRRLFDLPALVAVADQVPVRTRAAATAWALGVIDTIAGHDAKAAALAEVARASAGPVGLLVYIAATDPLPDAPPDSAFPTEDQLAAAIDDAGLEVIDRAAVAELADVPAAWADREEAVRRWIAERHGHDDRHRLAEEQEERIGRLVRARSLAASVLVLRRRQEA